MTEQEKQQEGREIVSWYVPPEQGTEVVRYYVQPSPLPAAARPAERKAPAAAVKKKRSRWKIWAAAAALLVLLIGGGMLAAHLRGNGNSQTLPGDDGESGSSIVDIFSDKTVSIPICAPDPSVRMKVLAPGETVLAAPEVYEKVLPSTVTVIAVEGEDSASVGTGVILTEDGYFITNAHVIAGGKSCWIATDMGQTYDAELVGYDTDRDLAVLKAVGAEGLTPAEFGDSDYCAVGETVYAIGNPLGVELRGTFTQGMLSAVNRTLMVDGKSMTVLQTTAALNNGNSGGPLINDRGQVIGINTLKMSGTGAADEATVEGLGFALPAADAAYVVNDILACGTFRGTPTFGFTVYTEETENGARLVVKSLEDGMPAAAAGIQAGDVILTVDDQKITDTWSLMDYRRNLFPGDEVTVTVLRAGQEMTFRVTLVGRKD